MSLWLARAPVLADIQAPARFRPRNFPQNRDSYRGDSVTKTAFPLFDGHNDSLTRFHKQDEGNLDGFLVRNHEGHLDLPRALDAGLAGGLFAIHAPDSLGGVTMSEEPRQDDGTAYKFDLPPELDQAKASEFTHEVFSGLENLASSSDGISIVKDFDMLQTCIETGQLAVIPHIEGAEAISADLSNLDDFYNRGLRSLGLVWSRPNRFGHGVPFAFPFSPDTGPGLTDAGKELVRALNQNGILIDLSHLNEKGFWQVADLTEAPLVASHSNAWELCR
ncbi:MAG: hypothetical protein GY867_02430, partial [bacterium]|nr:hypothetical protein [bacterium]